MNQPVKIYDTTLRDGAQNVGVSFSLEDKLRICRELDEVGMHYIEGGWPGSNPKDIAFFREARGMKFNHARLAAFSSTKRKGIPVHEDTNLHSLIEAETPVVTIFGKTWDLHVEKALAVSLEENLEMIAHTIAYLRPYFDEIIYDAEHFFDGYKANPGYALRTLQAAVDGECDWLVLCDTNGGSRPRECETAIDAVKETVSLPLGIHTHNDGELAVANSLAAVDRGIRMVQGAVNGLGERCGNANLCSVIPNLSIKKQHPGIPAEGLKKLTRLSRLVSELSNRAPAEHLPFVGDHAFAHKGGIHVSAVVKDPSTYEHIPPESVGNRRFVSISELSGKSNILARTGEMGIDIDKDSPALREVLEKVKDLEACGYSFEGAEASFELLCKSLLGQMNPYFTLHGYRASTWKNGDDQTCAEAAVKVRVPDDVRRRSGFDEPAEHASAVAGGPVEALNHALRKVLEKFYPALKEVTLIDYKVRILNEADGAGAVTRVLIRSMDSKRRWGTVGVSDNIIDASWQALTDSLIYKLNKDQHAAGPAC